MKNIVIRIGAIITFIGLVGVCYFKSANAYDVEHNSTYYHYRYGLEQREAQKIGVEYSNEEKRGFIEENSHDFLASILKEKRESELRKYFFDRWGIRGYMSNYYLRQYMRKTDWYSKDDLIRNEESLKSYIEDSFSEIK